MDNFKDKVAIVTGGGGDGIGNALVVALAKAGARVAFCDISRLDDTRRDVEAAGGSCYGAEVDIGDRVAVAAFIDDVVARFGGIDMVINNAGVALGDRAFEELTIEDFERVTRINYWGVIYTTLLAHPHILKRDWGAIVNVSSSQGILGLPFLVPYCTTKFAVRGFTDALRAEHRLRDAEHVQVHTVHPGAVATNITLNADYHNDSTQKFHRLLQKGTNRHDAAAIILDGVRKNKARIMISDGRAQDILTRLLPTASTRVVGWMMRRRGLDPRPMKHASS